MSRSNCYFLSCIQVSQETGKVVWHSRLFKNFPQFVVIHTVKGFQVVNEAEVDVSLEVPALSMIQHVCMISRFSRVQLFVTPMDCSLPGSSVLGFPQARILEWVAISFSRGSSKLRDCTQVSCIAGRFFTFWTIRKALFSPVATAKFSN